MLLWTGGRLGGPGFMGFAVRTCHRAGLIITAQRAAVMASERGLAEVEVRPGYVQRTP